MWISTFLFSLTISFTPSRLAALNFVEDQNSCHLSTGWKQTLTMKSVWTVERERLMLLLTISRANLKPSADVWHFVAASLGGGVSASAVRSGSCSSLVNQQQLSELEADFYLVKSSTSCEPKCSSP